MPALAGAGSLHSSANDLLTFLASLDRDRSPLAGVLTAMLETRRPGPGIPQALGWWIVATGPGDDGIVVHDGGTLGFASAIAYDLKTRTGVAVLSNTASGVGDIARHLLRPVIPLTKPAGAAPQKTEIAVDPRIFDRYAGRYEPAPGVAFVVSREGDALMIQLPGVPKLRLRPESERAFFVAENTRVTVTFEADSDGHVTRLVLRSPEVKHGRTRVRRPIGHRRERWVTGEREGHAWRPRWIALSGLVYALAVFIGPVTTGGGWLVWSLTIGSLLAFTYLYLDFFRHRTMGTRARAGRSWD